MPFMMSIRELAGRRKVRQRRGQALTRVS